MSSIHKIRKQFVIRRYRDIESKWKVKDTILGHNTKATAVEKFHLSQIEDKHENFSKNVKVTVIC